MKKPRLTLDELLKDMKPNTPRTEEEQAWLDLKPIGREILPDEDESWLKAFEKCKSTDE